MISKDEYKISVTNANAFLSGKSSDLQKELSKITEE
jgi:excinuclease UvrABC nuclease subunit